MRRAKVIVVLILALVVGLTLSAALGVYAQERGEREREAGSQGEVGGEGLNDPPPAGYSVLYTFTGARHETTSGREVATVVHCTNYGDDDASVRVEIYDWDDYDNFTFSGSMTVDRNHTATFLTQNTNIYATDVLMTQTSADGINQGSGRVMSNRSTLICTAQVVDPTYYKPYFIVNLDMYRY